MTILTSVCTRLSVVAPTDDTCGFSAVCGLQSLLAAARSVGALDKLADFLGWYGAQFYGWARPTAEIELVKQDQTIPEYIPGTTVVPLAAKEVIPFSRTYR